MKVAFVTTPPSHRSGIGDHARTLARHLAPHHELVVVLPDGTEGEGYDGLPTLPASRLTPRTAERVLYNLGNEGAHAFMLPLLRRVGGTVLLHDWVLFDLMVAAHPELERGGWRGHLTAWRLGGAEQRRAYAEALRRRRSGARLGRPAFDTGPLLGAWHEPEAGGRWSGPAARVRPTPDLCEALELHVEVPAGRRLEVHANGACLATCGPGPQVLAVPDAPPAPNMEDGSSDGNRLGVVYELRVDRVTRVPGDPRDLGVFVRRVRYESFGVPYEVDLTEPVAGRRNRPQLSDARFELPLQRPVTRFGDAFVVHSEEVGVRVQVDRNAPTAMGRVPHGVEPSWEAGDRAAARARLGLADGGALLLVTFGAIQEHKRPEPLLRALARARAAGADVHLVLAGEPRTEHLDLPRTIEHLGLAEHVTVTGFLEEAVAVDWMRAADLCVHLRGPSTGGTSGGAARALGCGRGVLASDLPEWRELPDGALLRVPVGGDEVERLADHLVRLADPEGGPEARAGLEESARTWAREEAAWPLVGARVARLLEDLPPHRTRRRSLLKAVSEAAERAHRARREGSDGRTGEAEAHSSRTDG